MHVTVHTHSDVNRATARVRQGAAPLHEAAQLLEFFDRTLVGLASLATAGPALAYSRKPTPAQDYPDSPHFQPVHPRQYMDAYERSLLDLTNDLFNMLQRAHLRANEELAPLQIRYEVNSQPLPNLYHLTTNVPDMTISVQLRDVAMQRRMPQVLRYRVSVGRVRGHVSVRALDDRLNVVPKKGDFKLDPRTQEFHVRAWEERLVLALIERARSAFRR